MHDCNQRCSDFDIVQKQYNELDAQQVVFVKLEDRPFHWDKD